MSTSQEFDIQLLAQIARRDHQALELFYSNHSRDVFSLVYAIVRDKGKAADITQEVFIQVWKNAGTYQPTGSARAWLLRLARNRAVDALRYIRRRSHEVLMTGDERWRFFITGEGEADAAERQDVREALEALPKDQREALLLSFFEGLSHQEIAAHLHTPLGTVKARIRRALHALRQHFYPDDLSP